MRVDLQPAIVLHRRAWRDTSLIVEALTRDHGRIAAVARGARRSSSRWRGLLEPLSRVELSWAGRGELYTLREVEFLRRFALQGNALMGGLYASELVLRLTARDDPHAALHASLISLLDTLSQGAPAIVALRFFERDLLDELGYGLTLDTTAAGEPIEADQWYRFDPTAGAILAAEGGVDEIRVSGHTLIGLANGRLIERERLHEARDLMQAALAPHLGARPLKSVATMQAMQQFAGKTRVAASDGTDTDTAS